MQQPSNGVSRRSFFNKASGVGAATFTILRPELVRGQGKNGEIR